jgi:glutathione S-transferase
MKLRYSPTSPYVRKVMVMAIETGLADDIELIPTNVWKENGDIVVLNPLGKVPTLITGGGEVLYDSPVICEYLDSLHDGIKLFPPAGGARWIVLRQQALADGILDAAVLRLLEGRRPQGERSAAWAERQKSCVERGHDVIEAEADAGLLAGDVTIGQISIGCALGWLDFRFPDDCWRADREVLSNWFEEFCKRPSMRETVPKEQA